MRIKQIIYLCTMLTILSSCGRNRMKNNEKALGQQILTEEQQLTREAELRAKREKQLADSLAKLPKGFRFKAERKPDQHTPPVIINIEESLENIADLKLSDVASTVKYIRLEPVPDPTLSHKFKFKYYLMDNYLVASDIYGIHLYTKDGRFIRTIVKNQQTGIEYQEKINQLLFWNDYTWIGGGTSVWARDNSLFYVFSNNITGQRYIMEYDCSKEQLLMQNNATPENSDKITGLGQVLVDLNHGNTTPPPPRKHQGMTTMSPEYLYSSLETFSPDRNTYISRMRGKNMLGILGKQGDTLATFSKLEQLKNYTKSLMRDTDSGTQYEKDGNLFFRSNFNDTIFRVVPPNILLPVYVLKIGKYKANIQEGADPDASLEGKIIPYDWAETKNYIFLTFTKDNYDCPYNRRNKKVKIYHAIYSKSNHRLQIVKSDPVDYEAPVLQNDIDGGCPVWPLSYQVGRNGEIMIALKGIEIKKQVVSKRFLESAAPANKKEELKKLAASVTDQDDILMIIE